MRQFAILIIMLAFVASCGPAKVISRPPEGIAQAKHICIIMNPGVRITMQDTMTEWLTANGYTYTIVPSREAATDIPACTWTLKYYARWESDSPESMVSARVSALHNDKSAGYVFLDSLRWDSDTFKIDKVRIKKLMNLLFGVTQHY